MNTTRPVSLRQLDALVDEIAARVSPERTRQLRMVAGMYGRALAREDLPARARRNVQQLFTPAALRPYWELAVAGELRHREEDRGKPLPLASQRIVRDCLSILATAAVPGRPVPLPSIAQQQAKEIIAPRHLTSLYRGLVDLAAAGPLQRDGMALSYEDRTRLLAMVAVVLDAAPRSGELEAMRLDDLDVDAETPTVRVRRRPQNASELRLEDVATAAGTDRSTVSRVLNGHASSARISRTTQRAVRDAAGRLPTGPPVETYPIREGTGVAVRRWLAVRRELVAPLEGARTALWVSLVATSAGPPGLPLRAQGIRRSYVRGMTALNFVMAGQYGWEPLPEKLERLRRSVKAHPIGPPGP
jgi:integrase